MPKNPLNIAKINQLLVFYGLEDYTVVVHEKLASTNKYAQDNLDQLTNNSVIVCEQQLAGVGRNDKAWLSRAYTDLTVSLIHSFPLDFSYELLPLVIAVAVNRLFKTLAVATKIKWPNDIYLLDKTKVAGILQTAHIQASKRHIITGIGLDNIGSWERNNLLVNLIKQVEATIAEYKTFGFTMLGQEWLDNCIHHRQLISLYKGTNLLDRGIHIDLTSNGGITLQGGLSDNVREYSGSAISLIIEDL